MRDCTTLIIETIDQSDFSPLIKQGFSYWQSKCKGDQLPQWCDINPAEIKTLLPSFILVQVMQDPLDFMEKITGETVRHHTAGNSMGKNWRDYPGREPGSQIWSRLENVVKIKQPCFLTIPYVGPQRDFLKIKTVLCPLSEDGKTVEKIITFVDFCSVI